jgi:hypothetical protein
MMGTVFTWNGQTVALQTEQDGPGLVNELLETTNFGSTNGFREYIAGPKDGGEIKATIHYDPTDASHDGATGLVADANANPSPSRAFSVNWGGIGTTWSGNAIITEFMPKGSFEDTLQAEVTFKVTGSMTVA